LLEPVHGEPADHDPAWEPQVEMTEADSLPVRIERRDQRVASRFDDAVRRRQLGCASEELAEAMCRRHGDDTAEVADKGTSQQSPHPKRVAQGRERHLANREPP